MVEQQGYYYHPHVDSLALGHPQLDFDLLAQPGKRSFNLKRAHFLIWENDNLRRVTLSHLVRQADKVQVLPGRFSLETFDGQVLNGFSFGSELQMTHFPDFARCHLTSPAPIANLSDAPGSPQFIIISELVALVAKERAGIKNDEQLAHKLAKVDPFQLFVASLVALEERTKKLAASIRTQQYQQLARLVSKAVQSVKAAGDWPASVPDLEALLR